jgi:hypothetical protein
MTLDVVYERLMHEFNQLEDIGHTSINGMIEKCAALALQFHGEMEEDDEMDDAADDALVNASNDGLVADADHIGDETMRSLRPGGTYTQSPWW